MLINKCSDKSIEEKLSPFQGMMTDRVPDRLTGQPTDGQSGSHREVSLPIKERNYSISK